MEDGARSHRLPLPRRLRADPANHARVMFFLFGAIWASWIVRIPSVRDRLALGPGSLGAALAGAAFGALIAMPATAWLLERVESGRVCRPLLLAHAACLPLAALAPSRTTLFAAAVALGLGRGALSIALNASAAEHEAARGRRVLGSFHALYSVGALVSAGIGGVLADHGVTPAVHLGLVALVVGAVGGASAPSDGREVAVDRRDPPRRVPGPLEPRLAGIALVALLALFGQSACGDWSAVYLRDVVGVSPGMAAAGYAAYASAMIVVRLGGDRLTDALGEVRVVRWGALSAALGIGIGLVFPAAATAAAGFAAVGAGSAIVLPIALRSAGRGSGSTRAMTVASAASFVGSLAGPLVIGATAALAGVRLALGWVVLSSVLVSLLAPLVRLRSVAGTLVGAVPRP